MVMYRRKRTHAFGLALCVLTLASAGIDVRALDPEKAVTQYIHESWQSENGLPDGSVTAIIQSRDGYLWLGTHRGLAYFDGVRFTMLSSGVPTDPVATAIVALAEDGDGNIWVASEFGLSVVRRPGNTLEMVLPGEIGHAVVVGKSGSILFGTEAGVIRIDGSNITRITTADGLPSNNVRAVVEAADGAVWIGTFGGGLARIQDGKLAAYSTRDGLPDMVVQSLSTDRAGTLWIGTESGVARYDGQTFVGLRTSDGLPNNNVRQIIEDHDLNIWIATLGGLARISKNNVTSITSRDGLTNDVIWSLCEDREGSLWIGTEGSGLNRLKDGQLTTLTSRQGLSNDLVCPILEGRDGTLWIGTFGGGLNRLKDGALTAITARDGLPNNNLNSLMEDRSGAIWIGTIGGGVCRYANGAFTTYSTNNGLSNPNVHALLEDREGVVWIGTEVGVTRFVHGQMVPFSVEQGLASNVVRVIHEDRQGRIWIGTNAGLTRISGGDVSSFSTSDGLPSATIWAIHEDAEGTLWFGTSGGIGRLKNNTFIGFSELDGLPDHDVFQILEDGSENFWISCTRGIYRVAKKDFDRRERGEIQTLPTRSYGRADGMKSEVCTHFFQPAGCKTRDGRLWFPTTKGAVMVDPDRFAINDQVPPIVIESLVVDSRILDARSSPGIEPGAEKFEFHYTGLSFRAPELVRFKYKLDGFDHDWVDAGTRRVAYYTNLPPGNYSFRVVGCNDDGVWNDTGAVISFSLRTPLWREPWAILVYVVLGLGLVYGGVRLRLQALKNRNRALEAKIAVRTAQLAEKVQQMSESEGRAHASEMKAIEASQAKTIFLSNMSHELRTPLNVILGFVQLMARDTSLSASVRRQLDIVMHSGEHLLGLINDVLSLAKIEAGRMGLNVAPFDIHAMLTGVEEMLRLRAKDLPIALLFEVDPSVPQFVLGDEGKLRQVVINLLGNSLKFTLAGHIALRVRWEDGACTFEVEDTGKGISKAEFARLFEAFVQTETGRQAKEGTGLGLAICQNFILLMGGVITGESELGRGTTFRFTVELPVADATDSVRENRLIVGLDPDEPPWRILVVDDRWEDAELLVQLLSQVGFAVRSAANGREAVDLWREWKPDVIWMDIRMPVMDGYEATKTIRSEEHMRANRNNRADDAPSDLRERPTVILGLTTSAFEHERSAILEAGCDDFVTKPYRETDIFGTIQKFLGVTYVYREADVKADLSVSVRANERAKRLARLGAIPAPTLDDLRETMLLGRVQAADRVISKIREVDGELADELDHLVKQFAFDDVLALIDQAGTGKSA